MEKYLEFFDKVGPDVVKFNLGRTKTFLAFWAVNYINFTKMTGIARATDL